MAFIIVISIMHGKRRLLLAGVSFYCILGLGLFFYLIVTQMAISDNKMRPLEDPKPEIYYSVFLKIIITLNIFAGVLRMLGSIFMLIYVRISNKIRKSKIKKSKF